MSWCLMLQLHSKKPEGRWWDQGSRHRSISSQVWLVECPWPQLLSVEDYWRSFQSFPFTLLGTTLVFKRGRWSQRSPVLRRSAWSCWPSLLRFRDSLAITHAIKRKKPNHYITEAIKRESPSSSLLLRHIPDLWSPQFEGAFVSFGFHVQISIR